MTVSQVTAEVTDYRQGDPTIPYGLLDSSRVISALDAKTKILANSPLQLIYYWPVWQEQKQKTQAPFLGYLAQEGCYVNAITGEVVMVPIL